MFAYLLLIGGLLYGTAAFAGGGLYAVAGIALCAWLAVAGGQVIRHAVARYGSHSRYGSH